MCSRDDETPECQRAIDATQQLPDAKDSVERLIAMFLNKGLSQQDLVTLSEGHTIGFVHCVQSLNRIYDFHSEVQTNPTSEPAFAAHLRNACHRRHLDPRVIVNEAPTTFDNAYYKNRIHSTAPTNASSPTLPQAPKSPNSFTRAPTNASRKRQSHQISSLELPFHLQLHRRNPEARQFGRIGRNPLSCKLKSISYEDHRLEL
ncbi:hypothetical protein M758_3G111600 [Ceratodon purpureus]|nr:hypothetical protein M758_3G111600 [Ceratodon purpureus]